MVHVAERAGVAGGTGGTKGRVSRRGASAGWGTGPRTTVCLVGLSVVMKRNLEWTRWEWDGNLPHQYLVPSSNIGGTRRTGDLPLTLRPWINTKPVIWDR